MKSRSGSGSVKLLKKEVMIESAPLFSAYTSYSFGTKMAAISRHSRISCKRRRKGKKLLTNLCPFYSEMEAHHKDFWELFMNPDYVS